jgi:ribosome-associated translation inhibitor RaiA
MKVTGKISNILPTESGVSKDRKEWSKLTFAIEIKEQLKDGTEIKVKNAFEIFGAEKVDKFLQYNKVGYNVDVEFNIKSKEYNNKFYTSLNAWKVSKAESIESKETKPYKQEDQVNITSEDDKDYLPF